MQSEKEYLSVRKSTVQTTLGRFFGGSRNIEDAEQLAVNITQLETTAKKDSIRTILQLKEGGSHARPDTQNEIIDSFKDDFSEEDVMRLWEGMRGGEKFDFRSDFLKNSLLVDLSQHAAIVLSMQGIECLNLRDVCSRRETKIFHMSEEEVKDAIFRAKQSGGVVKFAGVRFNAEIFAALVRSLNLIGDQGEPGDYSIAAILSNKDDDGHWPLLVRNNVTRVLGTIAPR